MSLEVMISIQQNNMERLYKCHCFLADFTCSVELGEHLGRIYTIKGNTSSYKIVFLEIAF